jgi:hypothetical protein
MTLVGTIREVKTVKLWCFWFCTKVWKKSEEGWMKMNEWMNEMELNGMEWMNEWIN